ncbi:hypothetical protein [Chloracidobacterium aggregatum]|uniref:hypothetical protein n=1 Tax=Chloracidobacterium aggregatum TaxID=2851959 RepID=UPI001B8ACA9B|nr:hypothetical protein [Chloracidobacterium aggregatum]QUV84846.1 hypothetical protein J8C03_00720 [Chloracidobacterium sp. 2]
MNHQPLLALALLGGLVIWPVASAQADTIRLKNGQTVVGKIVRYENRRFIIVYERSSPGTQAIIALEDIESVEFDGRPLPPGYGSSTGSTSPPDTRPPASSTPPPRTMPLHPARLRDLPARQRPRPPVLRQPAVVPEAGPAARR